MIKFIGAMLLLFALYQWISTRRDNFDVVISAPVPTDIANAPLVSEMPYQQKYNGSPFEYKDVVLTPLYDFIVTGRILSKTNYSDKHKAYVPTDLALGWGKMSDEQILKGFNIRQSNRFYYWRTDNMPMPKSEIIASSANMHLIPASEAVQIVIDEAGEGDVIQISGKLVNLSRNDGFYWHTSTTRKDSGGGACELIFVESAEILY